jgi:YidC/Oxa1 family membrane protein insertase
MRHAPFFGWIRDLSAPDPTTVFNLFGLVPWDPPMFLMLGAWPLIMGATMWFQQKLNPAPADPMQQRIFMMLPIVFTFMLAQFPAGLVIYWAWNNSLSILQQWVIMRRMGVRVEGGVDKKPEGPAPAAKPAATARPGAKRAAAAAAAAGPKRSEAPAAAEAPDAADDGAPEEPAAAPAGGKRRSAGQGGRGPRRRRGGADPKA